MIKRGEIYDAYLNPVIGNEQGGLRPVLIVQNNTGNRHSMTTIIAPMTTRTKTNLPTHVKVLVGEVENTVLLEQVRAISGIRLIAHRGSLSEEDMAKVDKALAISLGLMPLPARKERGEADNDHAPKVWRLRILPCRGTWLQRPIPRLQELRIAGQGRGRLGPQNQCRAAC